MAYFVAHLGVRKPCFLHSELSIQAAPLITLRESDQKCLFEVKAFPGLFFGVLILLLGRNLGNSGKHCFIIVKTALFSQKQGYLLRTRILSEISAEKSKSPCFP